MLLCADRFKRAIQARVINAIITCHCYMRNVKKAWHSNSRFVQKAHLDACNYILDSKLARDWSVVVKIQERYANVYVRAAGA